MGRLRDHLALLARAADIRVGAYETRMERLQQRDSATASLKTLQQAIRRAAQRSRDNREHLQQHAFDLLGNLERSLGNMGLTDIQKATCATPFAQVPADCCAISTKRASSRATSTMHCTACMTSSAVSSRSHGFRPDEHIAPGRGAASCAQRPCTSRIRHLAGARR